MRSILELVERTHALNLGGCAFVRSEVSADHEEGSRAMPLTKKGEKIKSAMAKEYGSKKKGEQVFYASKNAGTIKGVERKQSRKGR